MIKRLICRLFGHKWTKWNDVVPVGISNIQRMCRRCYLEQKTSLIMIEPHPENPLLSHIQKMQEKAGYPKSSIWEDNPGKAELLYGVGNRPQTPEISTRLSYEQQLRNTWLRHAD